VALIRALAVEYAIIQAARHFILEVDPLELRELKYDYKGA